MYKFITNLLIQLFAGIFVLLLMAGCVRQGSKVDEPVADSDAAVITPDTALAKAEDLPEAVALDLLTFPEVVVPSRLFTDRMMEVARGYQAKGTKHPFFAATQWGDVSRSDKWTELPLETWNQVISDSAPVTLEVVKGQCPLCEKKFSGLNVDLATPLEGKTRCCGETVYAKVADMPKGYAIRPNHFETLTHLDGQSHTYSYFVPTGAEGDRKKWLCVEGELARARLLQLEYQVLPDLSARLLRDTDGQDVAAARTLAAIFTRLAEVYPGLPLYNEKKVDGFKRGVEDPKQWYEDQLDAWRQPLEPYAGAIDRNAAFYAKLPDAAGYAESGRLRHVGVLAEAYDLLRHHPEMARISQARFGSPDALDEFIMQNLFRHMNAWSRQFVSFTGNMITVWFPTALKIAALTGDEDYLRKVAFIYESYLRNHFWDDGLSMEGAFNYSAMLGYLFREAWVSEEMLGIDFTQRFPLLKRIRELGDYPVVTLAGVESMHGDEHAAFFASTRLDAPKVKLDYSVPSQNFPSYGLACLRAGVPGARMELLMDYQNVVMHAHPARLNLQLFYQGLNLLPDVGYGVHNGKLSDPRWKQLHYPLDLVESPGLASEVEGHNTGTALGSQFGQNSLCFERYLGRTDSPLQMAQVEGKWIYETGKWPAGAEIPKVSVFNRQVAALTLPNGRALGIDFFRMQGGSRHDLFWHAPATQTECSLGAPRKINEPSLFEYYDANATPRPGWMKEATYLYHYAHDIRKGRYFEGLRAFENPVKWQPSGAPWKISWEIDPSRYAPVSAAGWARFEPWAQWLHPVNLELWGHVLGSGASENQLLGATAPWAGNIEMGVFGSSGRMAFKDGFHAVVAHRQGRDADSITSTFVHLLDPSTGAQTPVLSSVNVVDAAGEAQMGAIVGAFTTEGDRLLVASSLDGGMVIDPSRTVSTDARLAAVMPELAMLSLFDGTEVKMSAGAGIDINPMPSIRLIEVIGDLTGQPQESALIVESSADLPTGEVLSGLTLTVEHQTSEAHATGYEIEDIVALSGNRYRINLRNHPPFIERLVRITTVDVGRDGGSSSIVISHSLHDGVGRPNGLGRLLWLPRSGYRSTLKSQRVEGYAGWHSKTLHPTHQLTEGDAQVGDALVIYKIQSGDNIVIPELVSCRPVSVAGDAVLCDVFSTGSGVIIYEKQSYPIVAGQQIVKIRPSKENNMKIQKALAAAAALSTAALNVVAQGQTEELPTLEAHYAFEGNGNKAKDSTGRHPEAWITEAGSIARVPGQAGNALQLKGGSIVSIWKSQLALQPGKAVSLWIKPEASLVNEKHDFSMGLLASKAEKCYDGFITLGQNRKTKTDFLGLEDNQGNPLRFDLPKIEIGIWYHLGLSVSPEGNVTLFVDGKSVGTKMADSGKNFKLSMNVIGSGYSGGTFFEGVIDEVMFYNTEVGVPE
jgi:hypothetical protein